MFAIKSNGAIISSLLLVVILWGGSNVGTKYLVATWPPIWIGSTRLLCAGVLLLGILRWTRWLGAATKLPDGKSRDLRLRGGLILAVYILVFNWALKYKNSSHVALYLATSPIWTLLWEGRPSRNWRSAQRYGAAILALTGVVVLFQPALKSGASNWLGEVLGVIGSFTWANFGRQCRVLGATLSGAEVSAHTMWRAGALLLPFALAEVVFRGLVWRMDLILVQSYCCIAGGVVAYALWNNALQQWPTSQVFIFNNLIPLSTMALAAFCLREPVTPTFFWAMTLIVLGVILGQGMWQKILGARWLPME